MIFGKGKKERASAQSATRPLEAAALGRWRSINQAEGITSESELPESERLNSTANSTGTPNIKAPLWPELSNSDTEESENMNTAISSLNENTNPNNESAFIQEHIPLINLEQVLDEDEGLTEVENEINQTTFSLNDSVDQSDFVDIEAEETIDQDFEDLYNFNSALLAHAKTDFAHYVEREHKSSLETNHEIKAEADTWDELDTIEEEISPPPPPKERTPIGDFNLDIEDDLKNRFGANLKSALGHGTVIEGMFSFENPVKVDGTLKGQINSNSALIVGPDAKVHAKIKVGTLIILGEVEGEIEADDLIEIRSSGLLFGDVVTRRLALEEGSIFNGNCTMIDS